MKIVTNGTYVKLCVRREVETRQVDNVLIRCLDWDSIICRALEKETLAAGRNSCDGLKLGLELANGP